MYLIMHANLKIIIDINKKLKNNRNLETSIIDLKANY